MFDKQVFIKQLVGDGCTDSISGKPYRSHIGGQLKARVVGGFVVGVAIAFPLGLMMGSFGRVRAMFDPISVFGAYLPIPALVPLTLSLFGTGEKQKVAFLALAFLIYLLPLIVAAVDSAKAFGSCS